MLILEEEIAAKIQRKKKEFDREYAAGNFTGAVSIYDNLQMAADFMEISEGDICKMFNVKGDDKNKRLGIFDAHKIMDAKVKKMQSKR